MTASDDSQGHLPTSVQDLLGRAGLRLEQHGRRADVVLDRPQRRNSQTPTTWAALAAVGAWLDGRADVVVVRAAGPSFSAGLDRQAFTPDGIPGEPGLFQLAALDDDAFDAAIAGYQQGFTCWSGGSFVSVAAVQGHAVGAGFQLALACDLRIAADDAQFSLREPALGLVPDLGGTKRLVDEVGTARALEIAATARFVPADEALARGLVLSVVPAADLPAAVDGLVEALLATDGPAMRATAALMRGAAHRTLTEQCAAERAAQRERLRDLAARMGTDRSAHG